MKHYHVITHTHWDREWYFTKEETKVLLRQHMLDLFKFLEDNPSIIYILDGQSVMIDDFLELAPEHEATLKKYIASGNIRVGPWYTQTDLMNTRAESITRNLYYGLKKAREYTDMPMLVGYAPDTFGHNAQMPQVYKGFDINSSFFWRGISKELSNSANFEWMALDGTKIFGHSLSAGYQGGKYLIDDVEDLKARIETIESKYNDYGTFDDILVMNGHDQMPVQKDLPKIMETFNKSGNGKMFNTDFESYEKKIRETIKLPEVKGELFDAEFTRVHKTISSTRMDIKLLNTYVEDQIYNVLEPLSVIAEKWGIDYPHTLIEKSLKLLFGAHAHDSLGGCNTDEVNETIYYRLFEAKELVDKQIDLTLRQLGLELDKRGYDAFVINPHAYPLTNAKAILDLQTLHSSIQLKNEYGETIKQQVLKQSLEDMAKIDRQILARRLDVFRYETQIEIELDKLDPLSIYPIKVETHALSKSVANSIETKIENEFYEIDWKDSLNLKIKKTGNTIKNFIAIENNGDGGDGYDYSPLENDWTLGGNDFKVLEVASQVIGPLSQRVVLNCLMNLPYDETERLNRKVSVQQEYLVSITLEAHEPEIGVKIELTNMCKDQRTRLAIATPVVTNWVRSDCQYGNQIRPAQNPNLKIWKEKNWVEKPVSIEHFETYVSLEEKNIFYAKGLKEYEYTDSTVYFTLFRSFAFMGRSDLINRPGRASGMAMPTPLNQMLEKNLEFEVWLNYIGKTNPDRRGKELLTKLPSYQVKEYNRFNINTVDGLIPLEVSIEIDLGNMVITASKLSDDNTLVIRGYNPESEPFTLNLLGQWSVCNLNEEWIPSGNEFTVSPYGIFTLKQKVN